MSPTQPSASHRRRRRRLGRRLAVVSGALVTAATGLVTTGSLSADPGDVAYQQDFSADELPEGWNPIDGDWEVSDGRLYGTSESSNHLARITFGPHLDNFRVDATMRFENVQSATRWAGIVVDIAEAGDIPWTQAVMRSGSTAANGIEFAQRTTADAWNVTDTGSAPYDAGTGRDIDLRIEIQGRHGKWYFDDQLVLTSNQIARSSDGVLGFALSGATISIDDVVVTELEEPSWVGDPDAQPATVAHRGYSTVAPENTLAAVEAAIRENPEFVEIDTHASADGVPIVIHDASVDRTTDGTGAVANLTAAEIAALDAGSWFSPAFAGEPVPTLDDVLELIDGRGPTLLLEIKSGATRAETATQMEAIVDRGMEDQVLVQSFDDQVIRDAAELAPSIPRGILRSTLDADPVGVAEDLDVVAYNPNNNALLARPQVVADLHEAGIAVMPYTINDAGRWETLAAIGVDAIITDRTGAHLGFRAGFIAGSDEAPDPPAPEPTIALGAPADGAELRRYEPLAVATSTSDATEVAVTLDGEPIDAAAPIDLRSLDAGDHELVATATGPGGTVEATATFEVVVDITGFRVLLAEAPLRSQERTPIERAIDNGNWSAAERHLGRANLDADLEQLLISDLALLAG